MQTRKKNSNQRETEKLFWMKIKSLKQTIQPANHHLEGRLSLKREWITKEKS